MIAQAMNRAIKGVCHISGVRGNAPKYVNGYSWNRIKEWLQSKNILQFRIESLEEFHFYLRYANRPIRKF